jgi:5-methylcytosine-specific restriction enzyme A
MWRKWNDGIDGPEAEVDWRHLGFGGFVWSARRVVSPCRSRLPAATRSADRGFCPRFKFAGTPAATFHSGDLMHQYLYNKQRWKRRRKLQLTLEPLCAYCLKDGQVVPATVADHIVPHHGDEQAFFFGALQSLCDGCHSSVKAIEERRGFATTIGVDGFPTDPRHPFLRSQVSASGAGGTK